MSWKARVRRSCLGRVELLLAVLCVSATLACPEQLPLKLYTTADGLARDGINRIVRDSRGFLWFATHEGLSRFDGYQFTNYTADQGLPQGSINDLLETRAGDFWIATSDGVAYLNPRGVPQGRVILGGDSSSSSPTSSQKPVNNPLFVTYQPAPERQARVINTLLEDGNGAIWCGTAHGVYRLEFIDQMATFNLVELGMGSGASARPLVEAIVQDRQGALWFGTDAGLYRRWPDGRIERFGTAEGLPGDFINTLLVDDQGNVWVGTRYNGLCRLVSRIQAGRSIVAKSYGTREGLGSDWIASLFVASDGVLWVGTNVGLSRSVSTDKLQGLRFLSYTTANGLSEREVWALAEDRNGSLWIGTINGGAMKMAPGGFTSYDSRDGLGDPHVVSIMEDQTGALCVITSDSKLRQINRFDGQRFSALWPHAASPLGWGWNQITFQAREGEWWVASAVGAYRLAKVVSFEQLSSAHVAAHYTTGNGLGSDDVFRLFEDSRGDVWLSGISGGTAGLTKWERSDGALHRYGPAEGIHTAPTAFREDASGKLWLGFYNGALMRYANDKFTVFREGDGPSGIIRALYLDSEKRLWLASSRGGLSRIDQPAADHPQFVNYTTTEGLSSNDIWSITEDRWGRIYAGTGRGLDQLEPESGHVRHYTSADGLARGKVEEAFSDSHGNLWFGTPEGLSRFVPTIEERQTPPPAMIMGIKIAGVVQPISQFGETSVSNLKLDSDQRDVQIDFVGLDFAAGQVLRYQYKLEGLDRDWRTPTAERTVNYAHLSPGTYRFVVRALDVAGLTSPTPATIQFTIPWPIWERWWFLSLAALSLGSVSFGFYRYRLARLLDVERVRTRIATDLHDDIGSSLSQVSVLSEVIGRRIKDDPVVAEPLSTMAGLSRDLVDSMSDIVWAINPHRDRLSDLTQRMRRFASDVFTARDIEFDFHAPESRSDLKLDADLRRDLFLIFKEGINNTLRHSQCDRAEIRLEFSDGTLEMTIADNGQGFDACESADGNGLFSMNRRARNLGGALEVKSHNGSGTIVRLKAPLHRRRTLWRRFRSNGSH